VRVVPGGRVQWCDAGETDYAAGDRVLVDSDRGHRLGWIATAPTRRAVQSRSLRRVVRRANEQDLRGERDGEADRSRALRQAKDIAAALRLPLKVFRVEGNRGKLNVYYTSDERLDLRDFIRDLAQATSARIELRQLGVRDEAKAVGGIGSCGLTLCCTTWLPDFVPVSIKMAKDQGLVLSPTKVSGQCGRLKCCLVYEQAGYAELRKGLPKLGKRVISSRGEGRIVEVDVLRQRVRVSYGPGDTEVVAAADVRPMFPSGNPPLGGRGPRDERSGRDAGRDAGPEARDAGPGDPGARDPSREGGHDHDSDVDETHDDVADSDDPRDLEKLAHDPAQLSPEPAPAHDDTHDAPALPDDDPLAVPDDDDVPSSDAD
jgi:cell fate regulator YaaT (PSP1 superfamily)